MRDCLAFMTAMAIAVAAQYLTLALCVLLAIMLLMSAVVYPRRTFQLLAIIGLLGLAFNAPAISAAALGMIGAVGVMVRERR